MRINAPLKMLLAVGIIFGLTGASSVHASPTGGSGGALSNATNLSFTSGRYTSKYHLYAAGLDWNKPVGMLIYADGSGEYGLKNPGSSYLLAGADGLINVAKRNNMILLTPFSPNTSCADGDGSCWYMGDSVGYAAWAEELVHHIQSKYNIDTDRIAFGGYSSGAQLATEWWVPSGAAENTMTDGVIVAISYGGSPKMTESSYGANFKSKIHMNWNTGSQDSAYTGSGVYGVKAGYDAYTRKGFATSLDVVSGLGHNRQDFGKVMEAQIKEHVPAGTTSTPTPNPTPNPTPTPNPNDISACTTPNASFGTMTKSISVATTGSYRVWTRMMKTTNDNSNSFRLQIDENGCHEVKGASLAVNQWNWVGYKSGNTSLPLTITLSAGTHTLKFIGVQPSLGIDRVILALDGKCQSGPTGTGDNCIGTIDTIAPSLSIASPASTVALSGTVGIQVNAEDNSAVTKVEFFIDGQLKATATTAPYRYTWDTTAAQNGTHTVTAKAYDAAGNVGTDTRTYDVRNSDIIAPSTPTNVNAVIESGEIVVSWSPSTDNIGVVGYVIKRSDGITITAGRETRFVDANVLPGKIYSYMITAKDAAGNLSQAANSPRVTVPQPPDSAAPTSPTNLVVRAVSSTQANLQWTASTDNVGIAAYDVYRKTGNDAYIKVASTPSTSYGDSGLRASVEYSYYVIARDTNMNASQRSPIATITLQPSNSTPQVPGGTEPTTPANQTGVVRGRVTVSFRKALAGVRVTVTNRGKSYTAVTNSNGVYRIENIPAGRYSVSFTHDKYRPEHEHARIRPNRDTIVNERLVSRGTNNFGYWWRRWF